MSVPLPRVRVTAFWRFRFDDAHFGGMLRVAAAMLVASALNTVAWAEAKPARIVSLNLCIDDLVLRLAKPERIASVTWLSHDAGNSNIPEIARRFPKNHGLAEEIVPLDPDLVIAGAFSARIAVALLKRTRIPLAELGIPRSFAEIRQQIADVARLVGETQEGERLIGLMDARLGAIPPPSGPRPRAIVLNPNGATVGQGTLVGEIMTLAGLHNVAAELGIESYGTVPLEHVVLNAVDILIVSSSRDGPPALATEILRHPVLATLADRVRIITVPSRLWNCGGPASVEAVELLRQAVVAFQRGRATQ
jgi:iron complex transport system substrate-binding protein